MEQTSFLPEPPFAPTWPQPNTREARALETFLRGESLTTPQFEACSYSWRLAAVIHRLRAWGWPIEAESVGAPTYEQPHRQIACYRLPHRFIVLARELQAGGKA